MPDNKQNKGDRKRVASGNKGKQKHHQQCHICGWWAMQSVWFSSLPYLQ
ncbi:hypothetical protein AD29_5041 [Escherichia coli 2-222-05_S4_C3]|nr:hypothetical protein AD29_5041 [Escherichia coli 2-222-05_S4_C3]